MNNSEIIRIENLNKKYGNNIVLENLDFTLKKGEIVSLMGYSGVGKTTFINILLGLDDDFTANILEKTEKISCVFQEDRLLPWLSVYENIRLVNKKKSKDEINEILKVLKLENYHNYYPSKLSGGMKQRVSIARALVFESDVIIMDEPLKSTDRALGGEVLYYLKQKVKNDNISIILVTHDKENANSISDRVLELNLNFREIKSS